MKNLFAIAIAALFAVSGTAYAASHAGGKMDDKKDAMAKDGNMKKDGMAKQGKKKHGKKKVKAEMKKEAAPK